MERFVITGGTGTLGGALIEKLLSDGKKQEQLYVFSRDENKQVAMAAKYPNINYVVGDVSERDSIYHLLRRGVGTVFHCAALKHVDKGEDNVRAIKLVNLEGTINVVDGCVLFKVPNMVFFSTDKAVLPINAYGYSKALAEKYLQNVLRDSIQDGSYCSNLSIYRWGNVLGSRGSVIEKWVNLISEGKPIFLTDLRMTRFWISIEDAVDYVYRTFRSTGVDVRVCPEIKAYPMTMMLSVLEEIMGKKGEKFVTKPRPGEKIHECLFTSHEHCITSDKSKQYTREEMIEKLRPIVSTILSQGK
jgi:FlaA1/EpsC-like NDP-sugar epimerase